LTAAYQLTLAGVVGRIGASAHHVPNPSSASTIGTVDIYFGKTEEGSPSYFDDMLRYSPLTQTWEQVALTGGPTSLASHSMVYWDDDGVDKLVFFGGESELGTTNDLYIKQVASTTLSLESTTGDVPSKRSRHSATVLPTTDTMIVFGGVDGSTYFDDVHQLDLSTLVWTRHTRSQNHPLPRAGHISIPVSPTRMIIHGGDDGNDILSDFVEYNLGEKCLFWCEVSQTCEICEDNCLGKVVCNSSYPFLCDGNCVMQVPGSDPNNCPRSDCSAPTDVACLDGRCAEDKRYCEIWPRCEIGETRCGNGSCGSCDSFSPSCNATTCIDGSCVDSESECAFLFNGCSPGFTLCPDGSCAQSFTECPFCPDAAGEFLCADGSCDTDCPTPPWFASVLPKSDQILAGNEGFTIIERDGGGFVGAYALIDFTGAFSPAINVRVSPIADSELKDIKVNAQWNGTFHTHLASSPFHINASGLDSQGKEGSLLLIISLPQISNSNETFCLAHVLMINGSRTWSCIQSANVTLDSSIFIKDLPPDFGLALSYYGVLHERTSDEEISGTFAVVRVYTTDPGSELLPLPEEEVAHLVILITACVILAVTTGIAIFKAVRERMYS